jgi:hypothetical protein
MVNKDKNHYRNAANAFRKQRYVVVRGILPAPVVDYLKVYYDILIWNGILRHDEQCPSSLAIGGDPGFDALMEWLRPEISRLVGLPLSSTYSYTRRYTKGEILERHTDRPACEISMTISIAIPPHAKPSTIYLKPPSSKQRKVEMNEGDGCIYAGIEVEHWRKPFRRDGYIQLFLHFITRDNPNHDQLVFDGRGRLGCSR